jgi:MbtH protein
MLSPRADGPVFFVALQGPDQQFNFRVGQGGSQVFRASRPGRPGRLAARGSAALSREPLVTGLGGGTRIFSLTFQDPYQQVNFRVGQGGGQVFRLSRRPLPHRQRLIAALRTRLRHRRSSLRGQVLACIKHRRGIPPQGYNGNHAPGETRYSSQVSGWCVQSRVPGPPAAVPGSGVFFDRACSWTGLFPAGGGDMADENDERTYLVVINDEEQYSIWLADQELPNGWHEAGFSGARQDCLDHIAEVWTDMRPLSLRKYLEKQGTEQS